MHGLSPGNPVRDPLQMAGLFWPKVTFYEQQREIIYAIADNSDEVVVPAGNMLGKDFVSGFIILWFFLTRHPCRIVTTSAKEDHLRVLWGEIGRFIQTSRHPETGKEGVLDSVNGGPLVVNQREIKKIHKGAVDRMSYVVGMVAAEDKKAALQGHHIAQTGDGIPRTLFVVDEASSVPDDYYKMCATWANRILIIGNTWPCENFFKHAVKGRPGTNDRGGDIKSVDGKRYLRRVIRIKGEHSPNVQFALSQKRQGIVPTGEMIVPGVLPWAEYSKRRLLWDEQQQCVSLDAEWYEGKENKLFPPEWLNRAETIAQSLIGKPRKAKAVGIDTAEGGDDTTMAAVDELGLIKLVSKKTPDTNVITGEALAFAREVGLEDYRNMLFDAGGGGKEHADRMRASGYMVRTVAFGEGATPPPRRGLTTLEQRVKQEETRYIYKNRRAEMYGILRLLLEPIDGKPGFGIPAEYGELRRQLAPIPLWYDNEGRLELPPKNRAGSAVDGEGKRKLTLTDLIGCSPDEADALVLATFGMTYKSLGAKVGVAF